MAGGGMGVDLSGLERLRSAEWLLLVDHCDEVDADPAMRRWLAGRFLPRLLGRFPGLRMVLAAERGSRGPARERRSHQLRAWTAEESIGYLARSGVCDDASARAIQEAALPAAVQDAARTALRLRRFTAGVLGAVEAARQLSDVDCHLLTARSWVRRLLGGGHEVDPRVRFAYAAWRRAERPEEFTAFHAAAARVFGRAAWHARAGAAAIGGYQLAGVPALRERTQSAGTRQQAQRATGTTPAAGGAGRRGPGGRAGG
jgi:hypothetical protein